MLLHSGGCAAPQNGPPETTLKPLESEPRMSVWLSTKLPSRACYRVSGEMTTPGHGLLAVGERLCVC